MNIKSISLFSIFILFSCTISDSIFSPDRSNSGSYLPPGVTLTGSILTGSVLTGSLDHQDPLTENLSGSGNAYYPIFQGFQTKTIPIKHTSGMETKIAFINSEASSMLVSVTFPMSESGGNLRLAQIVMPDGTMDGPFGTDNTIELTQFGGYELRFHENMMSGDPWSGNAIIVISLLGK